MYIFYAFFAHYFKQLVVLQEVVVTTIAAQVNPPVFKLPERTLMRSTISVNDDVFVPRILNEEDFQDGRVTLPIISNSSKGNTKINVLKIGTFYYKKCPDRDILV